MNYDIFKSRLGSTDSKASEIAAAIRTGISAGDLLAGQRLAGATAIGKAFNCSGKPVEAARNKLVTEGLLVHRDGHYFVAGASAATTAQPKAELTPLVTPSATETPGPSAAHDARTAEEKLEAAFADLIDEPAPGAR